MQYSFRSQNIIFLEFKTCQQKIVFIAFQYKSISLSPPLFFLIFFALYFFHPSLIPVPNMENNNLL
jgi:hypothetical protein